MGSGDLKGVFRAFSGLHRKMSYRSICKIAGVFQTSENVCILDVSANSVLVLWYAAILRLGCRKKS